MYGLAVQSNFSYASNFDFLNLIELLIILLYLIIFRWEQHPQQPGWNQS